jgi:hypothetical protein
MLQASPRGRTAAMLQRSFMLLPLLIIACPLLQAAERSAALPHNLADVCPILPHTAPPGARAVTFVYPPRGAYVYGADVELQLQAADDSGADVPFSEVVVSLHL